MGWHYSDYDLELMTLSAIGDGRKLNAVGDVLAYEKLSYLLHETIRFHSLTGATHIWAQNNLGKKRDQKHRLFKALCSTQAWTNIGVVLAEALATFGISTAGKAFQASNTVMKTSKAFGIVGNIDTALNVRSDFQSLTLPASVKDQIKTPEDLLRLQKAASTVKARAEETFLGEMGKWSGTLSGGVAMYLYFLKKYHPKRTIDDIDERFMLTFISEYAARIVADNNLWNKIRDETPQPSGWEMLFGSGDRYNAEILTTGFEFVLYEVTMIVHNLHGHSDCQGGEAASRWKIVSQALKDASGTVSLIEREKEWWES